MEAPGPAPPWAGGAVLSVSASKVFAGVAKASVARPAIVLLGVCAQTAMLAWAAGCACCAASASRASAAANASCVSGRTISDAMANASLDCERKHLAQVEQCIDDGRRRLRHLRLIAKQAGDLGMDTTAVSKSIEYFTQSLYALGRSRSMIRAVLGYPLPPPRPPSGGPRREPR